MTELRLDVLAAGHGDALVVTYGPPDRLARILIDGGTAHSYKHEQHGLRGYIESLHPTQRHFELFIVTHIDADHIDGAILLLRDSARLGATFGEVWFNDWERIEHTRGVKHGELLGRLLHQPPTVASDGAPDHVAPTPSRTLRVNTAFGGDRPVLRGIDDRIVLPGGAELIVLSPRPVDLRKLARHWEATLVKSKFNPGTADSVSARMNVKYTPDPDGTNRGTSGRLDTGVANGSSIAVLLTYGGHRLLLAGDAHAPVLLESIDLLCERFGVERLKVDTFKLPHHGSISNLTEALLRRIDCTRFVVSTNGDFFQHPDRDTIDLITENAPRQTPPTIVFNYDTATTTRYRSDHRLVASYGTDGRAVVTSPAVGMVGTRIYPHRV